MANPYLRSVPEAVDTTYLEAVAYYQRKILKWPNEAALFILFALVAGELLTFYLFNLNNNSLWVFVDIHNSLQIAMVLVKELLKVMSSTLVSE